MPKLKFVVISLIAAGTLSPAFAQSNDDILKELRALKSRVEQLEEQLKTEQAKPRVDPADFNRIAVKAESLEDNVEALGFKGLKISGAIDPTYVYNRAQKSSSFAFLNNFSGDGLYTYDNSYFGMASLDIQKEMDSGTKWRLTLAPHKSAGGNYNIGSIVHEASVSIPLGNQQTRFFAGQFPDWSGYESFLPHQNRFITHNMLFDYVAPTFITGAGLDITNGKWVTKAMVGNFNSPRYGAGQQSPVLSYRVDYSKGEFSGFGVAGQHGKIGNANGGVSAVNMIEFDGFFIRGPLTLQGQVALGQQKKAAFNGGDSRWYGASALAAYKLTPRFELAVRGDYLNNSRNGGGTFNVGFNAQCYKDAAGADQACGDTRNGFGPALGFSSDAGQWQVVDANKGVDRYALSFGMNYVLNANATVKLEYRYDQASGRVFSYVNDGSFRKANQIFGASTVVSF